MIIKCKKNCEDRELIQDKCYIVISYRKVLSDSNKDMYYIIDEEGFFKILRGDEVEVVDSTYSKYWVTIKTKDNKWILYLPKDWVKEIDPIYYNGRMDEVDGFWYVIDDIYGSTCAHMVLGLTYDEECEYVKLIYKEHEGHECLNEKTYSQYQDPNIKIEAEPIGENWVLCPECHEVFEVNPDQGVVKCPNIACRELLNNPYAPKMPKEPKKE